MSEQEERPYRHLQSTMKATKGRSDPSAQQKVKRGSHPLRKMLSEDADVLRLAAGGMDKFVEQTAQRILQQPVTESLLIGVLSVALWRERLSPGSVASAETTGTASLLKLSTSPVTPLLTTLGS